MSNKNDFRRWPAVLFAWAFAACGDGGGAGGKGPAPLPVPQAPAAGTLGDGRLKVLLDWARNSQQLPAMAVIVIRRGQVAEKAAVGLRSAANENVLAVTPAGFVHVTLDDFAAYLQAHLAGGRGASGLLTTDSWHTLHAEILKPYALGWEVFSSLPLLSVAGFGHNGSNNRWFAVTWVAPSLDTAAFIVTNGGGERAEAAIAAFDQQLRSRIAASP